MRVVIIGGTGLIGSKVTARLRKLGHDAIPAAPNTGVNTITGEGLDDALKGTDVVIDVANSPSFEDEAVMNFFQMSGRTLLAAEARAGVGHHIALSVVGTDRLQESGYFRAKLVQENLVVSSPIPYSIVRSTQFFEFLKGITDAATSGRDVRLAPANIQPIASDDVALRIVEVATGKPLNGTIEIAGPDVYQLPELVSLYLTQLGDPRNVTIDQDAGYFGARLNTDTLVPTGKARLGSTDFTAWLQSVMQKLPQT
ncbi:MAG TPA: SDR family oxidoreductase [Cyclobacteriaceae bacterium]|nr:SDR family oxidoreductase [Cyclobacteriaceae bacterium]